MTFTAAVNGNCDYCQVYVDPVLATPGLSPVEVIHAIGDVQFYLNGNPVGNPVPLGPQQCTEAQLQDGGCTLSLNPPQVAVSPPITLPAGSNNVVKADYIGEASGADAFAPSSDDISFDVGAGSYTSTASAPASITYGQAARLKATVAPVAPSTVTPSGTVQFYVDGSKVSSPVQLDSTGTAEISDSDLTVTGSPHTVEAKFIPLLAWAGGLAAALLIGSLAGLLPAIRSARLSPTQALWSL